MCSKNQENNKIARHEGSVSARNRAEHFNQQPMTIWMTGLSAAGKSTLAYALELEFSRLGFASYVLDGDNVRHGINQDLGFSHQDRSENIRRVAEMAHLMNDAGLVVISAFISPFAVDRLIAKEIIGEDHFIEVYVSTPIATCEARDPKTLYSKARAGALKDFTGVGSPYEPPQNSDFTVDTSIFSLDICIKNLLVALLPRITLNRIKV